jgi:hypothetical protein
MVFRGVQGNAASFESDVLQTATTFEPASASSEGVVASAEVAVIDIRPAVDGTTGCVVVDDMSLTSP